MIESRYLKSIAAVLMAAALVFTGLFVSRPDILGITRAGQTPQYASAMFDKDSITTVDITVDEDQWQEMLDNALNEEYISVDVAINGTEFDSVGIRPKGNSSLTMVNNSDSDRFSFKLNADEYVKGQTFFGLEKFVLNNIQADATYMKEYLAYDMMEYLGVDTPYYAFAKISVNGQYWGTYLAVETMEDDFAQRTFGTDYGELYKPETSEMGGGNKEDGERPEMPEGGFSKDQQVSGGAMQPGARGQQTSGAAMQSGSQGQPPQMGQPPVGFDPPQGENVSGGAVQMGQRDQHGGGFGGNGADLVYTDDDVDSYSAIFDNAETNTDKSDYKRVIKALKQLSQGEDLESCVDVEATLRYFAANTALVNLDSYVSNLQHNYCLYEKDGVLTMLPWDLNLAFGGFQAGTATAAVNFPIDSPTTEGVDLEERPILGKLLEEKKYKDLYHQYLQELVDGYFNSGYFEETIDKLDALISDNVKTDPTAFYTFDEYKAAVETLKKFGSLRADSIEGQLAGTVASTREEQNTEEGKATLIDASEISLDTMGVQGGGKMGGEPPNGFQKGQTQQSEENQSQQQSGETTRGQAQISQPEKKKET